MDALSRNLALEIASAESVAAIDALIADVTARHGLSAYAGGMVTGAIAHSNRPFYFFNWSEAWLKLYDERGYLRKDPAARWAIVSGAPAAWTAITATLPPGDAGHEILEEAARHGYREGLVVPVRSASGDLGVVSSGGDRERLAPEEIATLAPLFGAALLRAEALVGASLQPTPSPLTLRERECASLMGQGLGDAQIAHALGISTETVRFHIDNARRKLGAKSRAQLAALVFGNAGRFG